MENIMPLWFLDESADIMDCAEGGLANHIFEYANSRLKKEQKEIFESVGGAIPVVAEIVKGLNKNQKLKLVFSEEAQKKMKDGIYRLMKQKDDDGLFKAVVVDEENKIREIASLKWEDVVNGVNAEKLLAAMQGQAVQQKLNEICLELKEMTAQIDEVLIGQHNDRLALFFSGEYIYREALSTKDEVIRKQLVTQAILSLTNAVSSLQATLAYEIQDLVNRYDDEKGKFIGIKPEKIKERMGMINSSFQTIHKAATLKAAIYYNEGEYKTLLTVLSDYKNFLDRCLSNNNASILYLADSNEKSLEGIWYQRQNELPIKIDEAKALLADPSKYSIEYKLEAVS